MRKAGQMTIEKTHPRLVQVEKYHLHIHISHKVCSHQDAFDHHKKQSRQFRSGKNEF